METVEVIRQEPALFTRPLVGVWTVLSVTPFDSEDAVKSAIEDGRLRWAWNIACRDSSKAMLRILAQSVTDFVAGRFNARASDEREFSQVERVIFPFAVHSLSASLIARAWNCASSHVANLCREGSLRIADHCPARKPGSQLMVDYASAVNFLAQRRYF